MNREELYKAMEHRKIIMYDEFVARLERTPWEELEARWTGALELEKEHHPSKNNADWLSMVMWNSTALTVGLDELARRAEEHRKTLARQEAEQRKKAEAELNERLSRQKLIFWKRLIPVDRRKLVESFMKTQDEFYQEYVRQNYLDHLETMTDRMVTLWFWYALPPFSEEAFNLPSIDHIAA